MSRVLAKIVVYVNWFLFVLNAIFYISIFVASIISFDALAAYLQSFINESEDNNKFETPVTEDLDPARSTLTIFLIIFGIIGGVGLLIYGALNVLLTKGVNQSDHQKCNRWIIINSIFFLLKLFSVLYSFKSLQYMSYAIPNLGYLALYGASLFIVKKFTDDLLVTNTHAEKFEYKNFGKDGNV